MLIDRSTPSFFEFDPTLIPFQAKAINTIYNELDYSLGTHEILFSGSIGSAKSLLAAHLVLRHCFENPRARALLGRVSLPDIKDTIFSLICEHLECSQLVDGRDYWITENRAYIYFRNGSEIMSRSWADKKYKKLRSLALSMAVIEEATENTGDHEKALMELRGRLNRLPHIKNNLILYCTNPDSPSHHLYKYFFDDQSPTRHVFFSLTEDNPFLAKSYVEQLKRDLPPREAQRLLYGKWVEVDSERIYYAYNSELNYIKKPYQIKPHLPISIAFDFNIGYGKPMSCTLSQYDIKTDTFHFFDECVVEGARTETILEELAARDIFELPHAFEIHGDATGGARSTNSKWSNYEIIQQFLNQYKHKSQLKLNYRLCIPSINPPIRTRHNIVNGYCENTLKERRLFVYEKCKVLHEGMKLTALKKGADYLEDDSKAFQHVTTALGYRVVHTSRNKALVKGGNIG